MSGADAPIYCAYARQSLARAGDQGDSASVADQFRAIEEHAARLGGRIVARWSDVDISGSTESRDGLDRLLAAVKTIRPHAVIVRDVSRLARDTRIFLALIDTLRRSGVTLLSTTENLEDRTISVLIGAMAERERLMLASRVAGGVREHARRGKTHGRPAFGYRRAEGVMTIDEPEAAVVRDVFAWFAAGLSAPMIARRLNEDPSAPKPPETPAWRRDTLTKMLKRKVYAGDVAIAARTDISGRSWPAVETADAHPAIVDRATWEAANRRFAAPRTIVREELVSPFSGFLWCAACGGRLYAVIQHRPQRPSDLRIARCASRSKRLRDGGNLLDCPGRASSRALARVERLAVDALLALLAGVATPDEIRAHAERIAAATQDEGTMKARHRLADIGRRRARLLEAYESGALDLATWQGRDRLLGADAAQLTTIIGHAAAAPDPARLIGVRDALADLPSAGLDYRALLVELGARVMVDLDNLTARIEVSDAYAPLFPAAAPSAP